MANVDQLLYVLACLFLVFAAFPIVTAPRVGWQWLAGACLVLTLIV